jgi:hypothetical protein
MMAKLYDHHARTIAKMDAWIEGTEACVWKLEANPEMSDIVEKHQEVPNEKDTVETVRALEDWYGDWHLAIGCRRQAKKRTKGDGGSRKKLAATRRRMTHRVVPARRKGYSHKGPFKDNVQEAAKTTDVRELTSDAT